MHFPGLYIFTLYCPQNESYNQLFGIKTILRVLFYTIMVSALRKDI